VAYGFKHHSVSLLGWLIDLQFGKCRVPYEFHVTHPELFSGSVVCIPVGQAALRLNLTVIYVPYKRRVGHYLYLET
jgi:hypothetical protein